jgi:hypothetical protein
MPSYRTKRAIQIAVGNYTDWIKRFDVNEYVQNPPLIEKLYEDKQLALVKSIDLENEVGELVKKVHELELDNRGLKIVLSEVNRKSYISFFLSLLATVLIGIGVNIATSTPYGWTGWTMIAAACVVEIAAFLIKPRN